MCIYWDHAQTQKYFKASKLRDLVLPEDLLCTVKRGITREQVFRLSNSMFIEKGDNVLVTGDTGCGNSFLACALGCGACLLGYRT